MCCQIRVSLPATFSYRSMTDILGMYLRDSSVLLTPAHSNPSLSVMTADWIRPLGWLGNAENGSNSNRTRGKRHRLAFTACHPFLFSKDQPRSTDPPFILQRQVGTSLPGLACMNGPFSVSAGLATGRAAIGHMQRTMAIASPGWIAISCDHAGSGPSTIRPVLPARTHRQRR